MKNLTKKISSNDVMISDDQHIAEVFFSVEGNDTELRKVKEILDNEGFICDDDMKIPAPFSAGTVSNIQFSVRYLVTTPSASVISTITEPSWV